MIGIKIDNIAMSAPNLGNFLINQDVRFKIMFIVEREK